MMTSPAFDGRFDRARSLIMNQKHQRVAPLRAGEPRWQTSAVLRPDPDAALSLTLHELMQQSLQHAGPDHWRTGSIGTAHLTVRSLGDRIEDVQPEDRRIQPYVAALHRATVAGGPLSFTVQGLLATPGSVMAVATPADGEAERFLHRFTQALVAEGEDPSAPRDIWHLNLLHFAAPIADPRGLLDWIEHRRDLLIGSISVNSCELVRWDVNPPDEYPGAHPVTLAQCPFGRRP